MWEFSQSKGSKLEIGRVVRADVEQDDATTTPTSSVVTSVQLDTGTTIPADILVIACGPWTEEARYWFPDDLPGLDRIPTITGVKCHSILMQAPKVLNQAVFFESNGPLGAGDLEVYPRPDGDAYVNGFQGDEGIVQERPGEEAIEADAIRQLQSAMDDVSSLLEGRPPHTQQACYWPETPDGLPMIGRLSTSDSGGLGNAFIATGHSVWGILQGPATGKALAEWIVDGKSSCLDLTAFRLDRFSVDDQSAGSS